MIQCGHCGHPITGECKDEEDEGRRALLRLLPLHLVHEAGSSPHPRAGSRSRPAGAGRLRQDAGRGRRCPRLVPHGAGVADAGRAGGVPVRSGRNSSGRRRCSCSSRIGCSTCGWPMTSTRRRSPASSTEMRDRLASIKLQLDVLDRSHDETAELASKVFELSQTLRQQWLTADYAAKRRILEIVCLNCRSTT